MERDKNYIFKVNRETKPLQAFKIFLCIMIKFNILIKSYLFHKNIKNDMQYYLVYKNKLMPGGLGVIPYPLIILCYCLCVKLYSATFLYCKNIS